MVPWNPRSVEDLNRLSPFRLSFRSRQAIFNIMSLNQPGFAVAPVLRFDAYAMINRGHFVREMLSSLLFYVLAPSSR